MSSRYTINLISWQSEVYYRKSGRTTSQQGHLSFFIESFLCSFFKLCLHLPIKRGSLFEDNTDKLTSQRISSDGWVGAEVQERPTAATCLAIPVTKQLSLVKHFYSTNLNTCFLVVLSVKLGIFRYFAATSVTQEDMMMWWMLETWCPVGIPKVLEDK